MGWKGTLGHGRRAGEGAQRISWHEAGGFWYEEQEVRLSATRWGALSEVDRGRDWWTGEPRALLAQVGKQASWGTHLTARGSILVGRVWLLLEEALAGVWPPYRGKSSGRELMPMKKIRNSEG